MKKSFYLIPLIFIGALLFLGILTHSCSSENSAPDAKYLPEFQKRFFVSETNQLKPDDLSLYVDYSTCISVGQSSQFFQSLIPSFVTATKNYYSIKGPSIEKHENADVFYELNNIVEVNYADLRAAADKIVTANSEGVLLTDGEFYQKNISGGGISDPYLADPFKIWLRKGHDIYVMAEPYVEKHNGNQYSKKRFYFLFTDNRLKGNIYDRICETVNLNKYPEIEVFHLAADHPIVEAEGDGFKVNSTLSASVNHYGSFEVQDWPLSWESIEEVIMGAVDPNTGEALPNGESIMSGLKVDKNSYGGFEISDVALRVYDINADYLNFYNEKLAPTGQKLQTPQLTDCLNTFVLDKKEFKENGSLNIYLDTQMWTPANILTASPFNYTKIDIVVAKCNNVFNQNNTMFDFDAIGLPGKFNTSVTESVKQCLFDPDIQKMMNSAVLYTVYVKSNNY